MPLDAALEGTGLAGRDLTAENRIPYHAALRLLERAADLAECPTLGLRLGSRLDHTSLGLVGRLMQHGPTLRAALLDYAGVQMGYSRGASVYLQRHGDEFTLGYAIYAGQTSGGRQAYDMCLAIGLNLVRTLSGGRARPRRVLLSCRPPLNVRPYEELFRAPVEFDQEQSCLVLPAEAMDAPISGADPAERARTAAQIRALMSDDLDDVPARVRHLLRPRLLLGEGSMPEVARDLGLHPRTLGRRLAQAGTGFDEIRDEVRFAIAQQLLGLTDLPVGEIAASLSYATHSAFVHAFNRWTGMSPTRWRREMVAGVGP